MQVQIPFGAISLPQLFYKGGTLAVIVLLLVPQNQHVGDVMEENNVKPVEDWDMNFPQEISALRNKYETGQVGLHYVGYSQILSGTRDISVFTYLR